MSSNFVYNFRVAKYIVGKKPKVLRFILPSFFLFSISHSNVMPCLCSKYVCLCVNIFFHQRFLSTISKILKFGTKVGYDKLYCVKENQPPPAYHSLYLFIFLFIQ